jgi:hypothetical protein
VISELGENRIKLHDYFKISLIKSGIYLEVKQIAETAPPKVNPMKNFSIFSSSFYT